MRGDAGSSVSAVNGSAGADTFAHWAVNAAYSQR